MKMGKWILPLFLYITFLQANDVNAGTGTKEMARENTTAITSEQNALFTDNEAYQNFNDACTAFEAAQMEKDVGKRSQFYADAIKSIAKNVSTNLADGESFLLAARIYRAKGGLPFAKKYLKRADDFFYETAIKNPQSVIANLDYAVFCYAANLDNNHEQNKKAQLFAEKTLKLIETNNSLINLEQANNYLRYKALANLARGDIKNCEKFLEEAAEMDKRDQNGFSVNESVSSNCSFEKRHLTGNIFYDSLFKDTVLQQKMWIRNSCCII